MKTNNYVRSLEGEINLYNTESQIMRFDPRRSRCHQAALSMCLAKRRPLYRPSTLYRLCVWSQQNSTDGRKWWPSCLWCVSIFLSLIWNLTSERKSYNVIIARMVRLVIFYLCIRSVVDTPCGELNREWVFLFFWSVFTEKAWIKMPR